MRDMTQKQFDKLAAKYGFKPVGFLGYYTLPAPYNYAHVSIHNAGTNRRAQLAYLFNEAKREAKRKEGEESRKPTA